MPPDVRFNEFFIDSLLTPEPKTGFPSACMCAVSNNNRKNVNHSSFYSNKKGRHKTSFKIIHNNGNKMQTSFLCTQTIIANIKLVSKVCIMLAKNEQIRW